MLTVCLLFVYIDVAMGLHDFKPNILCCWKSSDLTPLDLDCLPEPDCFLDIFHYVLVIRDFTVTRLYTLIRLPRLCCPAQTSYYRRKLTADLMLYFPFPAFVIWNAG